MHNVVLTEKKATLLLLLTTMIWGGGFIFVDLAMKNYTPFQVMTIRFFLGGTLLSIIFKKKLLHINKRDIIAGVVVGVLLSVPFAFQLYGQYFSTPAVNAIITTTYVVFIPIFDFLFFKQKTKRKIIFSAILTLIGILLITIGSNSQTSLLNGINMTLGVVLTSICAAGYAIQIIAIERYIHSERPVDPTVITILMIWTSFIISLAVTIFMAITKHDLPNIHNKSFLISSLSILYLGFFATAFAFTVQSYSQKFTKASKVAILLSLESVFGAMFSCIFLGERFTLITFFGFAVVFIAVLIAEINLGKLDNNFISSNKTRKKGD